MHCQDLSVSVKKEARSILGREIDEEDLKVFEFFDLALRLYDGEFSFKSFTKSESQLVSFLQGKGLLRVHTAKCGDSVTHPYKLRVTRRFYNFLQEIVKTKIEFM